LGDFIQDKEKYRDKSLIAYYGQKKAACMKSRQSLGVANWSLHTTKLLKHNYIGFFQTGI